MFTLREVDNHEHILAASVNLTEIVAIKLYNQVKFNVRSAIFDADNDLVNSQEIARYMYHLELNRRVDYTYNQVLDRAMIAVQDSRELAERLVVDESETIDFDAMFTLKHSAMILIPSTLDVDKIAPQEIVNEVIDFVSRALAERFGGANVSPSRVGLYVSNDGKVIREDCTPINVRLAERTIEDDKFIARLAASVRRAMRQESVYFELDEIAYFI